MLQAGDPWFNKSAAAITGLVCVSAVAGSRRGLGAAGVRTARGPGQGLLPSRRISAKENGFGAVQALRSAAAKSVVFS